MKFPRYNKSNIYREEKEGEYKNSDFAKLIEDLYQRDEFENETEKGISAKVIKDGTLNLSENQAYNLQKIFDRYNNNRCSICNMLIPYNEVIYLDGNLCNYHQDKFNNDKDCN